MQRHYGEFDWFSQSLQSHVSSLSESFSDLIPICQLVKENGVMAFTLVSTNFNWAWPTTVSKLLLSCHSSFVRIKTPHHHHRQNQFQFSGVVPEKLFSPVFFVCVCVHQSFNGKRHMWSTTPPFSTNKKHLKLLLNSPRCHAIVPKSCGPWLITHVKITLLPIFTYKSLCPEIIALASVEWGEMRVFIVR